MKFIIERTFSIVNPDLPPMTQGGSCVGLGRTGICTMTPASLPWRGGIGNMHPPSG